MSKPCSSTRLRRFAPGLAAALVLATATAGMSAAAPTTTSSMFVDVAAYPTVAISVVVPGASTKPPTVLENGLPVKLLSARDIGRAPVAAIVIDHSRSMRGAALKAAVGVAEKLLADRRPHDRMAVFAVASHAELVAPFSLSATAAEKAVAGLKVDVRYGTALYDGIVLAARAIKHEPGHDKVIFVISDGQSTDELAGVPDAATAAAAAGAAVYPITIDTATYLPRRLRALSRATSGAFLGAATRADPTDSAGIAADVRRTWRLEYVTDAKAGETITVQVDHPGAAPQTATTRVGGVVPQTSFLKKNLAILLLVVVVAIAVLVLIAVRGSNKKKKPPPRRVLR